MLMLMVLNKQTADECEIQCLVRKQEFIIMHMRRNNKCVILLPIIDCYIIASVVLTSLFFLYEIDHQTDCEPLDVR